MVTKYNYYIGTDGLVKRRPAYSFTTIEELSGRLDGIDNENVISNIAAITLKGEAERTLIEIEDGWFKVQSNIQDMDAERIKLEDKLSYGDSSGNPLTPEMKTIISARIAELTEGTIVVKKEYYNHYTRETIVVDDVTQTPYTIALEKRIDLETSNPYLKGYRGVSGAPERPESILSAEKETSIRKQLVRQKIDALVGDDKDLIADMSQALSALIKKVAGESVTADEEAEIAQYVSRQSEINAIMAADYNK